MAIPKGNVLVAVYEIDENGAEAEPLSAALGICTGEVDGKAVVKVKLPSIANATLGKSMTVTKHLSPGQIFSVTIVNEAKKRDEALMTFLECDYVVTPADIEKALNLPTGGRPEGAFFQEEFNFDPSKTVVGKGVHPGHTHLVNNPPPPPIFHVNSPEPDWKVRFN